MIRIRSRIPSLALLLGLLASFSLPAIEPEEVREYGDVFLISAEAPERSLVRVSWTIARGYYLYNNRFLQFRAATPGVVLGEPRVPPGKVSFDELLGEEVEKYTGRLEVEIPIVSADPGLHAFRLNVKSQGCLEGVLCYPPTEQVVLVGLSGGTETAASGEPAAAADPPSGAPAKPDPLADIFGDPRATTGAAAAAEPALPAEAAFRYEAIALDAATALVRFTVQPGYYLYRDKFAFRVADQSGFEVRDAALPEGVIKDDPEFGPVPVIYELAEIPVRFYRPAGASRIVALEAGFQGCRDGEICYPPQSRVVEVELPAANEPVLRPVDAQGPAEQPAAGAPPLSEQDRLARLLGENPRRAIIAFFLAGILLAFTPCVFPMVPILSGIIAGQGRSITALRAFWLSLTYVLAMAVTYTVAGVLAGLFGQNLQATFQNPWILGAFVLVFIALALSMFGLYELQLPSRLQTRLAEASGRQRGGRMWGVAVMGFLSALIVGPCVAPPLMAALIVIGASGDAVLGGTALFALSLGMGLPLILFGVSAGKLMPRAGAWMGAVKAVFGVGLLALAIWLLERILPGGLVMVLWGLLAIACGVYLGALERIPESASGWKRLWKALGAVLLLVGALELIGAAAGGEDWLRPLRGLMRSGPAAAPAVRVEFQRVKSLSDLQEAVAAANSAGQGAMLDFYADWCVECLRMERNTFPDQGVQALLAKLSPLQADVTGNDDTDRELMREFGIIGPPAILFFDRSGREMPDWRLVGYFTPDEFSRHLQGVLSDQ